MSGIQSNIDIGVLQWHAQGYDSNPLVWVYEFVLVDV